VGDFYNANHYSAPLNPPDKSISSATEISYLPSCTVAKGLQVKLSGATSFLLNSDSDIYYI
jgi:hypothetical protein